MHGWVLNQSNAVPSQIIKIYIAHPTNIGRRRNYTLVSFANRASQTGMSPAWLHMENQCYGRGGGAGQQTEMYPSPLRSVVMAIVTFKSQSVNAPWPHSFALQPLQTRPLSAHWWSPWAGGGSDPRLETCMHGRRRMDRYKDRTRHNM